MQRIKTITDYPEVILRIARSYSVQGAIDHLKEQRINRQIRVKLLYAALLILLVGVGSYMAAVVIAN